MTERSFITARGYFDLRRATGQQLGRGTSRIVSGIRRTHVWSLNRRVTDHRLQSRLDQLGAKGAVHCLQLCDTLSVLVDVGRHVLDREPLRYVEIARETERLALGWPSTRDR